MLTVEIFGHEIEIGDRLQEHVETKANKLDRYLNSLLTAKIDLTHAKNARDPQDRYISQITVAGTGYVLRAEERADDVRRAFDASMSKIERQIARYKGKHYRGKGDGTTLAEEAMEEFEALYSEEEAPAIARRKKFLLSPMDEEEAMEQMRLLGHEDFFVFFNMAANCVSLLYKRRDGSMGLIDTELA